MTLCCTRLGMECNGAGAWSCLACSVMVGLVVVLRTRGRGMELLGLSCHSGAGSYPKHQSLRHAAEGCSLNAGGPLVLSHGGDSVCLGMLETGASPGSLVL